MDVKLHVSILRRHSEYLTQLFTEVTTTLSTLEQTLSEREAPAAADTVGRLAEVAGLERRLCTEAEMFCQRLHVFLAVTKTVPDATVKNESE